MNNMGPFWLLALALALLHTVAQVNCAETTDVDSKLVTMRKAEVVPSTPVDYGNTASVKCSLLVDPKLSDAVYHLWVYRQGLPYRIAAFHPPSTKNEYPRELVAHPECFTNDSTKACPGRKIQAIGTKVVNLDKSVKFTLELKFHDVICCDNADYYCWFFIYSDDMPAGGFNSTTTARLSVNCNPLVLAVPCYQKDSSTTTSSNASANSG